MYYVYEWYIIETGEIIYVGKGTHNRYKVRKHNKIFNEFIRRFKCDSRIVKTFENEQDAFNYEFERVLELKFKGQCVCNINKGGAGGTTTWWNDERRDQYSKNNVMKNEKQRERMSINNPMKNKETARRVAEMISRKVCIDNEVYDSLHKAAESCNVSPQLFMYWMDRGYTKDHRKCYYYGEKPKDIVILDHSACTKPKSVVIDGITYDSISEAARAVGGTASSLCKALKKGKTFKGYECHFATP